MVGHFSRQRTVEAQRSTFASVCFACGAGGRCFFVVWATVCTVCVRSVSAARKLKTESKRSVAVVYVLTVTRHQNIQT